MNAATLDIDYSFEPYNFHYENKSLISLMKPNEYIHDIKFEVTDTLPINCRNNGDQSRMDIIFNKRAIITDDRVKWKDLIKNETIQKNYFTQEYYKKIPKLDEPINKNNSENADPKSIDFSKLKKRSFYPNQCLVDLGDHFYFPLNPIGATGLRGRGFLEKWGPNHQIEFLITRWKKNSAGSLCIHTTDMKPVLEGILVELNDKRLESLYGAKGYSIPFIKYKFGYDNIYGLLSKKIRHCFSSNFDFKKFEPLLEDLIKSGKRIYFGYVDDPRNTDNAWIESQMFNFHDKEDIFDNVDLERDFKNEENFEWKILESSEEFYLGANDLIRRVTKYHNAHY